MKTRNRNLVIALAIGGAGALGCGEPPADDGEAIGVATAALTSTPVYAEVSLLNGWTTATNFTRRTAGVALVSGLVQLKGGIRGGTSALAFNLPAGFRPATDVYVPVDLCSGTNGRLLIQPTGDVSVQTLGPFSDATCLTSLDGASFAPSASGFTALTLLHGWTNAPFSTSNAAARNIGGVVRFKGAVAGGTGSNPFNMPPGMNPPTDVFIPIKLCSSNTGQLHIAPSGQVNISVPSGVSFSQAQCFTSLDGASYAITGTGFTSLTPQNGWFGAPPGTNAGAPAIIAQNGVARFKGGVATTGTNTIIFNQLPAAFRPTSSVSVTVTLCNSAKGELNITSFGQVSVVAPAGFADAACTTSLEGAQFTISDFAPLVLMNGWVKAGATAAPAVGLIDGIVRFKGAITSGTSGLIFTLPPEVRPVATVFLPASLGNGAKGRITIDTAGNMTVSDEGGGMTNAQLTTSLDGVSYPASTASYTPITPMNGWTNAPFSTRGLAARNVNGTIHFAGAMQTSLTNQVPFQLTGAFRPSAAVYLPVDVCDGHKGRILIQADGTAVVSDLGGGFVNAKCFTSLEGVSYALSTGGTSGITLQNGWVTPAFGNRAPRVQNLLGVVRLQGAISTSGTNPVAFSLLSGNAPSATVLVEVDMCDGKQGRLAIDPSGTVTVQPAVTFGDGACFTSLEGVSFGL